MSKQFSFVNFSGLNLVNKCIVVFRTLEVPLNELKFGYLF